MKKIIVIILILTAAAALPLLVPEKETPDYIRIHIRANSDEEGDQAVKLLVRDTLTGYLIPLLAECETSADAYRVLSGSVPALEKLSSDVLSREGYSYKARVKMKRETFPARSYGGLTLDAGVYDALIIELGSGKGDNWWCVAFPPLCFVPVSGSKEIRYKSKILEIIKKYGEKANG